jgi:surfeit locus 1 family protein
VVIVVPSLFRGPALPPSRSSAVQALPHLRRRIYIFVALAAITAVAFTRLGFWQLARLRERQEYNGAFTRQQILKPVAFEQLPHNPDSARYRGAQLTGIYDYEHEMIVSPRTRRGSPGVEIITPVRRTGTDTAVLVDRGWVYSPDISTIDLNRWRERDSANVHGYVEVLAPDTLIVRSKNARLIHRISRGELAGRLPYPIAPVYLIAIGDTTDLSHPARRDLPVLDEGNHLNYAIQWFTFALISVVGAALVIRRERRTG